MTREQRAHKRHKVSLAVEVVVDARRFTAVTRDVSAGGCCIESAYPLAEGSQLTVTLYLVVDGIEEASMPGMAVGASVQWNAENEEGDPDSRHISGLKFTNATAQQTQWLEGVIQRSSE